LYDETTGIGGMNHFRLPDSKSQIDASSSLGVHAMELLINAIMNAGGDRRRLKAKIFGGSSVLSFSDRNLDIGARNIQFAEQFLETERIPIVTRFTGGDVGMQVFFNTGTAKVFVKQLDRTTSAAVGREEHRQADNANSAMLTPKEVTLF
jgi:chemotaxis protein CheD